jgi:hypothetical protein
MRKHQKEEPKFVACITDSEPDLESRKIYQVLPDPAAEKEGHLRIIDESGEDYLYPVAYFVTVEIPKEGERLLLRAS